MKTATIFFAFALTGCSSLDPNVGPRYTEPPVTDDAGLGGDAQPDGDDTDPGGVSFARDIRPIINRTRDQALAMGAARGCVPCHVRAAMGTGAALSGFDVSTLGELRKGGGFTDTRIIVPYKPDESYIVKALRGQFGSNRMPKGGPGPQYWEDDTEEMRMLTTWIREGAKGKSDE
jgi:hypothetical protein